MTEPTVKRRRRELFIRDLVPVRSVRDAEGQVTTMMVGEEQDTGGGER